MANILIVEDDDSIRELIKMTLELEGHTTTEVNNGQEAWQMILKGNFDLILLDIMLPGMDGYRVLERIKAKAVPVIFLTAKVAVQDKVFGLKLGADDYITKPFEPMELLARIESVLRRGKRTQQMEDIYTYEDITIKEAGRSVRQGEEEIILTTKEFDLLLFFVKSPNIVFTREELLDQIWGYDYYGGTRTVDMHITQLRKKLQLKGKLETVFKVGYKLKAEG